MLYRLNRVDQGALAFGNLIKDADIASVATDVVNYQYGEALVEARNYASAIDTYKAVVDWPKSDRSLVTLAHLHAGKAFDALAKRAEATREYKLVLKEKNVYDSHELAKKYQEKPFVPDKK
jgi:tetratricopeptide (TPR) repeat protein